MDVYYAPAWGRHYTAAPDGSTRWLTDAEEADLAARTTPQQGLFGRGTGDGAFDALIRPATPRTGVGAVAPRPADPADRADRADRADAAVVVADPDPGTATVPAPRRAGAVTLAAVVAGTLGLVAGLLLGAAGVAAGSDAPGAGRPVVEVPAGR